MTNYEIAGLRGSLGISSTGFELSEEDYFQLYQFDVPENREAFLKSCDQVKAQYPNNKIFDKLVSRYAEILDKPEPLRSREEHEKKLTEYYSDKPGMRQRLSNKMKNVNA